MTVYNSTQTIVGDLTPNSGSAIFYGAAGITLTIPEDSAVVALDAAAVFADDIYPESVLINNGTIFSASAVSDGVRFDGDFSTIINNEGGSIGGFATAILFFGDDAILTNHGFISGLLEAGVRFGGPGQFVLTNDGDIFGHLNGVLATDIQAHGTINNSGAIRGDTNGILIDTGPGLTTVIKNNKGGLIQGDSNAIYTDSEGRLSLDNRGKIEGTINCTAPNESDVVVNLGKIIGGVFLGDGNDTYRGKGGGTSGDVFGEGGDDTLIGGRARDTVDGGTGNDLIRGGRGKDFLFGGADHDLFDFNSIRDSVRGSKRDVIQDFQHGANSDDIDLRTIDAKAGVAGNQKFTFVGKQDFHDKKGELRIEDKGASCIVQGDVNGDGKADFEIFVKVGSLAKGDFLL